MKNSLKILNDLLGRYKWLLIFTFLSLFLFLGSKTYDLLLTVYFNTAKIETANKTLINIEDKLIKIEESALLLNDIEANTAK